MSTLNLGLTDAPVSGVTKVWIQFTGIEVKPAGAIRLTSRSRPKGFDLLSLQGGTTATFLNGTTVPAGQYEWVRLMVTEARCVLRDGLHRPARPDDPKRS